jgi:hypothetical protein
MVPQFFNSFLLIEAYHRDSAARLGLQCSLEDFVAVDDNVL